MRNQDIKAPDIKGKRASISGDNTGKGMIYSHHLTESVHQGRGAPAITEIVRQQFCGWD